MKIRENLVLIALLIAGNAPAIGRYEQSLFDI